MGVSDGNGLWQVPKWTLLYSARSGLMRRYIGIGGRKWTMASTKMAFALKSQEESVVDRNGLWQVPK